MKNLLLDGGVVEEACFLCHHILLTTVVGDVIDDKDRRGPL